MLVTNFLPKFSYYISFVLKLFFLRRNSTSTLIVMFNICYVRLVRMRICEMKIRFVPHLQLLIIFNIKKWSLSHVGKWMLQVLARTSFSLYPGHLFFHYFPLVPFMLYNVLWLFILFLVSPYVNNCFPCFCLIFPTLFIVSLCFLLWIYSFLPVGRYTFNYENSKWRKINDLHC